MKLKHTIFLGERSYDMFLWILVQDIFSWQGISYPIKPMLVSFYPLRLILILRIQTLKI